MNFTKIPVVLLCGNAGVGKDTVGQMIVDRVGWKKFAQADIIKEISKDVFGFTDEQLWGPSEFRNALDQRFAPGTGALQSIRNSVSGLDSFLFDLYCTFVTRAAVHEYRGGASMDPRLTKLLRTFCAALVTFADSKGGLTPRIVLQLLGTEVGRAFDPNIWVGAALRKTEQALLDGASGVVVTDGRFRNEILGFRRFGGYAVKIIGDSSLPTETHQSEKEIADIPDSFYDVILQNPKPAGLEALSHTVKMVIADLTTPYRIVSY